MTLGGVQSDSTTYLTLSSCHSSRGSDVVETANDAENAGGPCDGNGDFDANSCISWSEARTEQRNVYSQKSHHAGAQLMAFPFQTIESTKWTRQASAVQTMYMQVPTFQASKCQYRGTTARMNPIPENTENTVVEAVISDRCDSSNRPGIDMKSLN